MQNIHSYAIKTIKLQFYIDIMKNSKTLLREYEYRVFVLCKQIFISYLLIYLCDSCKQIHHERGKYVSLKITYFTEEKKSLNNTSRS